MAGVKYRIKIQNQRLPPTNTEVLGKRKKTGEFVLNILQIWGAPPEKQIPPAQDWCAYKETMEHRLSV